MTSEIVETDAHGRRAVVAVEETHAEREKRLAEGHSEAVQRLSLTRSQANRLRRAK